MRKILPLFIFLSVLAPLSADSDIATLSMTGGYSMKDNTALMGFNGSYAYYVSVGGGAGVGAGVHGDISFGLNHEEFSFAGGFIGGLGLEFRLTEALSLNILAGPGIVAESGINEPSVGIGAGIDASVSYFFGDSKTIGITAGISLYPQFLIFDDAGHTPFRIAAYGYAGMSFRFPASIIAMPAMLYLFD